MMNAMKLDRVLFGQRDKGYVEMNGNIKRSGWFAGPDDVESYLSEGGRDLAIRNFLLTGVAANDAEARMAA